MWLMCVVFALVPLSYFVNYGATSLQLTIYFTTLVSLLLGFAVMRIICIRIPLFRQLGAIHFKEKLAQRIIILMLVTMSMAAFLALNAMTKMGVDYRLLFFTDQYQIFGYERFGFLLQIFTEYGALALFSLILTQSPLWKWRAYLLIWAILGTVITLGRWYMLYAALLFFITRRTTGGSIKHYLFYLIGFVFVLIGGSLIFTCRGGACNFDLDLILHGVVSGIGNYLYIPIDMVFEYQQDSTFDLNLLVGFIVYPIEFFGRFSGLYNIDYQYDRWAVLIQDYVYLPNVGAYNAFVGQPLTSFVAAGYIGIFIQYLTVGLLIGVGYYKSNYLHPISVTSIVIGVTSFLIPSISGPMFVISVIFLIFFSRILTY